MQQGARTRPPASEGRAGHGVPALATGGPAPPPASQDRTGLGAPDRYNPDVWGKSVRSRGGRGKRAMAAPAQGTVQTHNHDDAAFEWDLAACRDLLTKLDPNDLRERLHQSPWHNSHAPRKDGWLREAASAFDISLRVPGERRPWKTKGSVVDEVMRKVAQHRSSLSFAAAMEDEQRRHGRLAPWNRTTDVRAARRDIPLFARIPGGF